MTLSEFSLHRPVASIVMSLVIVLFGAVGFNFLGVRLYPAIDPPMINVRTNYTGANADIIESQITEPLEKAINGIEGIKSISSSSATGSSNITVEFNVGADLEKAANDVRDKVSQAVRNLPLDIDAPPVVTKADANSDPIITVSVQSTTMNALELSDYAENILQEKLQTIPGVSSVALFGQKRPAMRLWLNPDKMAAYNITPQDVNAVLGKGECRAAGRKTHRQIHGADRQDLRPARDRRGFQQPHHPADKRPGGPVQRYRRGGARPGKSRDRRQAERRGRDFPGASAPAGRQHHPDRR